MIPLPPLSSDDLIFIKEGPLKYKIVSFSPSHRKIADVIGSKGIELPKKAEKMAVEAVSALSSAITINSDLDIGENVNINQVEADMTLHVHIMPWQDGISLEILFRPFGSSGSYFRPGKGGANVFAEIDGLKMHCTRYLEKEIFLADSFISSCSVLDKLEEVEGLWLVNDPVDALELLFEIKIFSDANKIVMKLHLSL
jgi:hypothetical protein